MVRWVVYNREVPPANTLRLLDQRDVSEATTQQLTRSGEAGDTSTDDANPMLRFCCSGNAAWLLDQASIIKAKIRRIGKTCSPRLEGRDRLNSQIGGMVV